MIGDPPSNSGTVKPTAADASPAFTTTSRGAVGTPTFTDTGADAAPPPNSFTARTAIVYSTPLVNPVTSTGDTAVPAEVHVDPPSRLYS